MKVENKTRRKLVDEFRKPRRRMAVRIPPEETGTRSGADLRTFKKAFVHISLPAALTNLEEGRYIDVSESFLQRTGIRRVKETLSDLGTSGDIPRQASFHRHSMTQSR